MIYVLVALLVAVVTAAGLTLHRYYVRWKAHVKRGPVLCRDIGTDPVTGRKRVVLREWMYYPPAFWPWFRNEINRVHAIGWRDTYLRVWPNPGVGVTIGNRLRAAGLVSGYREFVRDTATSPWRLVKGG